MKENEGKFDFLALVVKFGFRREVTAAFCKMRWLVRDDDCDAEFKEFKNFDFFYNLYCAKTPNLIYFPTIFAKSGSRYGQVYPVASWSTS